MTHVGYLLTAIEDPFQIFPLESVASSLGGLVTDSYKAIADRSGWWGVSRKYYSVEQEHEMEKISLLIGASFVLGQAAITQTAALALKIRELAGKPTWLPASRTEVLQTAATFNVTTRLSVNAHENPSRIGSSGRRLGREGSAGIPGREAGVEALQ